MSSGNDITFLQLLYWFYYGSSQWIHTIRSNIIYSHKHCRACSVYTSVHILEPKFS